MISPSLSAEASAKDIIAGAALAALLIWNVFYWFDQPTVLSDAIADWAQVRAVQEGVDPYTDVVELASRFGAQLADAGSRELGPGEWIHPRTPGALLLLFPIGYMDSSTAHDLYVIAGAIALWILAVHLVVRVSPIGRSTLILGTALMLASAPIVSAFEFGTVSLVVAGLILVVWIDAESDRQWISGLCLGLALILKAWPAILLIPLLVHRRFRAAAWCVGLIALVESMAWGLFRIAPGEVVSALSSTSNRWIGYSGNGSLSGVLVRSGVNPLLATIPAAAIGASVVAVASTKHKALAYPLAIVVGLLVSPLSWEHYDVALLAIAAITFAYPSWPRVLTGGFLLVTLGGMALRRFATDDFTPIGLRTLAGRLLMLGAVGLSLRTPEPGDSTLEPKTPESARS